MKGALGGKGMRRRLRNNALRIGRSLFLFVVVSFSEQLLVSNGQVEDTTAGDFFLPT